MSFSLSRKQLIISVAPAAVVGMVVTIFLNATDHSYPTARSASCHVMAIFGLAVVGAVGAFDYRDVFVGSVLPMLPSIIKASNEPNKIAPASREPQAKNSDTASQADTAVTGSIENLVSRENKPVITSPPKPPTPPAIGHSMANQPMPRHAAAVADPPWSPHATTDPSKGAGQSGAVDVTVVTPPVLGGGYAVQISSEHSESRAQTAFRGVASAIPQPAWRPPADHSPRRSRRRHLLSDSSRPLCVGGQGGEVLQRIKSCRRQLHHPEKLTSPGTCWRRRESTCRVGHDLHHPQPPEAVRPRKGRLRRLPCNKCPAAMPIWTDPSRLLTRLGTLTDLVGILEGVSSRRAGRSKYR